MTDPGAPSGSASPTGSPGSAGSAADFVRRWSQIRSRIGSPEDRLAVLSNIVAYLVEGEEMLAYADRDISREGDQLFHVDALIATSHRLIRLKTTPSQHIWLECPLSRLPGIEVRWESNGLQDDGQWSPGEHRPEILITLPAALRVDETDHLWISVPPEREATTPHPLERVAMWRRALERAYPRS